MKIQEQHLFHGPALVQIVEHRSFKALNKADKKYGHYAVNDKRRLFVKYLTKKTPPWVFAFSPAEIKAIKADIASGAKTFLSLVCGTSTICCLAQKEIQSVVDLNSPKSQSIRVEVPKGGSQRVSGSAGALKKTIAHNAYPKKVLS